MTSVRVRLHLPPDPAATERLGERLGARLVAGCVLALRGDLGAGKTTLVRGLARGLAVDDAEAVHSPTYLLVVEHPGRVRLLHADAYLPAKLTGFLDDGGLDYLLDPSAVVAVEWAERIADRLPRRTLWVDLAMAPDGGRDIDLHSDDGEAFPWLAQVAKMPAQD